MAHPGFDRLGHNFMQSPEILPTDSPDDIIIKCGFNFSLVPEAAGYVNAAGVFVPMPKRKVLRRSDDGRPVSIVSDGFAPHQPKTIIGFFLDYAKQFGMNLTAAGVINFGRMYWALAKTSVTAPLNGGDDIAQLYALLATGSDGTLASISVPTGYRPGCSNSWRVLMTQAQKKGRGSTQYHRSEFDPAIAAKGLGFDLETSASAFEEQCAVIRELNNVTVDDETAKQWFRDLLRPKVERDAADEFKALMARPAALSGTTATIAKEPRGLDAMMNAYHNAPAAKPGTARGLWEATTHYIDHVRGTDDARAKTALFGQGNDIKERAWENVTALLSVN